MLLVKTIWSEESFEARQIAGKCLEKFGPKYPKICLDFISIALPNLDNWAVCDNLAMFGVEPIVYSNPGLVLPLSEKWIKSGNKWIRRFGVVSLRGYKKIKVTCLPAGMTDRVFKILDIIMGDKDKDVKKAAAWILREITKKNPREIFDFLIKWTKAASPDTKWIIKDGVKKLSKQQQEKILAKCFAAKEGAKC